jgi:hypothetical protein
LQQLETGLRAPAVSLMVSYSALKLFPRLEPAPRRSALRKIVASLAPKDGKAQPRCSTKRSRARHNINDWKIIAGERSKAAWSFGWV